MPSLPSTTQFRRSYTLEIGGTGAAAGTVAADIGRAIGNAIKIESIAGSIALRIAFDVYRKNRPEPNSAKVMIYNLNPESRAKLEALDDVTVRLAVGYQDSVKQIFFGTLSRAQSTHDGTEWVTEVSGGDGTVQMSSSRIQKSFARGTPVATVLGTLVDAMKIGRGNLASINLALAGKSLSHGVTISGPVAEELTAFTTTHGLNWSIQDGDFFVSHLVPARPTTQGPLISPTTGLIGSPVVQAHNKKIKKNKQGIVTCRALILPELIPGLPYRLESDKITGNFLAIETRHTGDSTEQDWYVEVKGKML